MALHWNKFISFFVAGGAIPFVAYRLLLAFHSSSIGNPARSRPEERRGKVVQSIEQWLHKHWTAGTTTTTPTTATTTTECNNTPHSPKNNDDNSIFQRVWKDGFVFCCFPFASSARCGNLLKVSTTTYFDTFLLTEIWLLFIQRNKPSFIPNVGHTLPT